MLEIAELTKRYPNGTVALSDFSLAVGEGVLGLLGPNGAGKTTLMSIVATVLRPTAGSVRWRGVDALRRPARRPPRARLPAAGLRRLRQAHRRRAAALLRAAQGARRQAAARGGRRDDRPRQPAAGGATAGWASFSGGMRQRVGHRAGAARRPQAADRRRADGRARSRGAGALPQPALASSGTGARSSSRPTSSPTSRRSPSASPSSARGGWCAARRRRSCWRTPSAASTAPWCRPSACRRCSARSPVSSLTRRADGVHVRFVGAGQRRSPARCRSSRRSRTPICSPNVEAGVRHGLARPRRAGGGGDTLAAALAGAPSSPCSCCSPRPSPTCRLRTRTRCPSSGSVGRPALLRASTPPASSAPSWRCSPRCCCRWSASIW